MQDITHWYADGIDKANRRFPNVSKQMIATMIRMESSGNKYAVSKKGALGLMQLMPATAFEEKVYDPFNANENIMGGTALMSNLLHHYHGNVDKSLAAYNAGEGRIDRTGLNNLPSETQNYIGEYHKLAGN